MGTGAYSRNHVDSVALTNFFHRAEHTVCTLLVDYRGQFDAGYELRTIPVALDQGRFALKALSEAFQVCLVVDLRVRDFMDSLGLALLSDVFGRRLLAIVSPSRVCRQLCQCARVASVAPTQRGRGSEEFRAPG